jgi:hypothetical protein
MGDEIKIKMDLREKIKAGYNWLNFRLHLQFVPPGG